MVCILIGWQQLYILTFFIHFYQIIRLLMREENIWCILERKFSKFILLKDEENTAKVQELILISEMTSRQHESTRDNISGCNYMNLIMTKTYKIDHH